MSGGRAAALADDASPARAPACAVGNSFVTGTLVLMADGTSKRIDKIREGDLVMASDPESGARGPRRVTATIVGGGAKELIDVVIGGRTVTATDRHPFWADNKGRWADAQDLERGDVLLLAAGKTAKVGGLDARSERRRVHNLGLEGINTYFVGVGHDAALVHNCTPEVVDLSTAGRTADETAAIHEYARRTNEWLGKSGAQTVRSTDGAMQAELNASRRAERLRAQR